MKIALIPGSFDPITLGHLNVIERASKMFDKVYVAVMNNDSSKYSSSLSSKTYTFTAEERLLMAGLSVSHLENVETICREGILLIDLFDELGATAIVKGIRNEKDLEYEMIHAKWNKEHNDRAETLFLPADEKLCSVSSTAVRQLISEKNFEALEGVIHKKTLEWLKSRR